MKILHHHRTASRDGQSVHIDELIDALRQLGHEVIVVAPSRHDTQAFGESVGWIARIRAAMPKMLYDFMEFGYSIVAYRKLAKVIRATRPDVIYERYNLFLLAGIWAKRRFGLPLLLEVNAPLAEERATHGGLGLPALARWTQRLTWRGADRVLPVTQVLAGDVAHAGVPAERIEVIHNGINPQHFQAELNRDEAKRRLGLTDRFILGFTGFVRSWHGLNRVIDWIAKQPCNAPEIHLLIVGDGPERPILEAQAQTLGIMDRVTFTGVVEREGIPAMVSAFDIALQPAVVDYASPLKLFEYLALGRAIIAPRQPNLEEILTDGENALLFDPAVHGALENTLSRLLADQPLREHLGQGARRRIETGGYTWTNNARRVVALFKDRLEPPGSRPSRASLGASAPPNSDRQTAPIKTLLFSTLYPSSVRPGHGIFVETRLRHLLGSGEVETRVIAPVPWFPFRHPRFGDWAKYAATPTFEERNGVQVWHPRYLLPPKIGMNIAPIPLALGARRTIRNLIRNGDDFDLIDAHYYYPDGVAAALLAGWFKKPFVITARGTDLNLIPKYAIPRRWIRWAERRAAASIGVCKALTDRLIELGGDPAKTHVLRNGVDLERFQPLDQTDARARLGLPTGLLLLSVGHLVERKGHHLAIETLKSIPAARLAILGDGPEHARLIKQAQSLGVADRVTMAGARRQEELKEWYSAADILLLCSSREGWANVLLESMACGTPAVATPVGGTPEIIRSPVAGHIIQDRTPAALVSGIRSLLADPPERGAVREYAEQFDWAATTQGQIELFRSVLDRTSSIQPLSRH
ncbi:glycosyltransferase [Allochromatium vinosum]|uniref:glycosyltransferase n=1 Tax=Allochromatium vinosum TaxID=1049 RepID=UPI001F5B0AA1|nr:glycosyltransferase [Allochromatium vinosum]MBK1656439.1 hypothetical protein [Allochromatium vinosum]